MECNIGIFKLNSRQFKLRWEIKRKAIRACYRIRVCIAYIPLPLVHPRTVIVKAVRICRASAVVRVYVLVVNAVAVVIVVMVMRVAIAISWQRSRRGCRDYVHVECERKIKRG